MTAFKIRLLLQVRRASLAVLLHELRGRNLRKGKTHGLTVTALPAAFISLAAIVAAPHATATRNNVTYDIDSDGSLASVTYFDSMDDEQQVTDVNAPWTTTFTSQATIPEYGVGAQTNGLHVSCRITVNGEVRDQKSAVGRYAVVNCNA